MINNALVGHQNIQPDPVDVYIDLAMIAGLELGAAGRQTESPLVTEILKEARRRGTIPNLAKLLGPAAMASSVTIDASQRTDVENSVAEMNTNLIPQAIPSITEQGRQRELLITDRYNLAKVRDFFGRTYDVDLTNFTDEQICRAFENIKLIPDRQLAQSLEGKRHVAFKRHLQRITDLLQDVSAAEVAAKNFTDRGQVYYSKKSLSESLQRLYSFEELASLG